MRLSFVGWWGERRRSLCLRNRHSVEGFVGTACRMVWVACGALELLQRQELAGQAREPTFIREKADSLQVFTRIDNRWPRLSSQGTQTQTRTSLIIATNIKYVWPFVFWQLTARWVLTFATVQEDFFEVEFWSMHESWSVTCSFPAEDQKTDQYFPLPLFLQGILNLPAKAWKLVGDSSNGSLS